MNNNSKTTAHVIANAASVIANCEARSRKQSSNVIANAAFSCEARSRKQSSAFLLDCFGLRPRNDGRTRHTLACFVTAFLAMTLLTSCSVDDPIHQTAHPDHGKITITTDWSGIGQGAVKPAEYYAAYGTEELKATQDEYTFPNLFDPGSYTIRFYNKPEGIAISQSTATADYTAGTPGWLFTARLQETLEADRDYAFTVPMAQQVRQLTLVIEPTGGAADRIAAITATLSGVAATLDFDNGTHGMATTAGLTFTKDTDGKYKATVRLLGIVTDAEQKLSGTITFTGGEPDDTALESDLTAALANFNDDKKTPLTLGGTVAETPTGAGFTATITGWTPIPGGSGVAN